jgi:DNA polymerase-3 subunit beta
MTTDELIAELQERVRTLYGLNAELAVRLDRQVRVIDAALVFVKSLRQTVAWSAEEAALEYTARIYEQQIAQLAKEGGDGARHFLPYHHASDFPEPDAVDAETATIKGELLNAMLSHTAFAVFAFANDVWQGDQKFTGLHWTLVDGQLTIAATNKLRLAIARAPLTSSDFAVITPQQVVPALRKFNAGDVEIGVSANGNLMLVRTGGRLLTMRLLVDKPLDWVTLFPAKYDHAVEVETGVLADSLKRALVTSDDKPSFVINGLKWQVGGDELRIESRDSDQGKSEELLPITCPSLNGNTITLGMNGVQVVDYLNLDIAGEKTRVELTEGSHVVRLSPVVAKEFSYEYLVNTISLKW